MCKRCINLDEILSLGVSLEISILNKARPDKLNATAIPSGLWTLVRFEDPS